MWITSVYENNLRMHFVYNQNRNQTPNLSKHNSGYSYWNQKICWNIPVQVNLQVIMMYFYKQGTIKNLQGQQEPLEKEVTQI